MRLPPVQKSRARRLRAEQTDAERRLWQALRDRQLAGAKFRRQYPIGRYVADFACVDHRLIVELDGGHHSLHAESDSHRTVFLQARGFRVLRFWDHDVLKDTEAVLESIRLAIMERPSP
ncbi:MAG: endonuclease domain-containing protein [Sulfurifustaceae bacterium]